MAAEAGWPLPQLAYKRNVYWNNDTVRQINGMPIDPAGEDWLPTMVPAAGPIEVKTHRVDMPDGTSVLALPASQVDLPQLPADLHLALVLDRSRSMANHTAEVSAAFAQLKQLVSPNTAVEVYLTASPYRGEASSRTTLSAIDPQEILYFGGQNAAELLVQFETLSEGEAYDAILVFTDGSGYELGASVLDVPVPPAPLWLVHLGSDIPLGYDDDTLEAIQASGGGVVGDLDQALTRLAVALGEGRHSSECRQSTRDFLDGYLWLTLPTEQVEGLAAWFSFRARVFQLRGTLPDPGGDAGPARGFGPGGDPGPIACHRPSVSNRHALLLDDCPGNG